MIYAHRTIEPVIEQASARFKALLVSGMRQVGKSTLLNSIKETGRINVSLDEFAAERLARTSRDDFFKQYPAPLIIDEIQRVPDLCLEVKVLLDSSDERGRVWLTGSQRFEMMKSVSESLAGRLACFELLPFSIYEREGKGLEQKPY